MTELVPFSNDDYNVRTLMINGEPWFVAMDIATQLGYRDATNMLGGMDLEEDELRTENVSTSAGTRTALVISEPGLYNVLNSSRRSEAKPFKRWVNHDVLPALRRGELVAAKPLTRRELAQKLLDAEIALEVAQEAAEVARAQLAIDSPKAAYYDSWLNSEGLIGKRELARLLVEHFGGKITEWEKRLTVGGDLALWGKGNGIRGTSIILAGPRQSGLGSNKWVENANTGQVREFSQGFITRKGLEWVISKIERQS